jgi:hypothetical protein
METANDCDEIGNTTKKWTTIEHRNRRWSSFHQADNLRRPAGKAEHVVRVIFGQ